jgi:cytochrome b subunit of formate dehydrogenase
MARKTAAPARARNYVRFTLSDRVQHLVMLLSFTTLGITGLVQKYPINALSLIIVRLWGGVENIRATHHVAATVLMLVAIYHVVGLGYKVFVLRHRMSMLPGLQDIKDAWMAFIYNIGLGRSRPQMGRYTFEEKAEYWALVWGILIMGLTGFMMWNPLATVRLLPGEFIPAAKAAHGAEAILAVLAIIVWHMYGVHLKRFNQAMWTGRLTEEEMLHEHPLELADLKAGAADRTPDAAALRKRQMIYYPVAGLLAVAMLFAVYGFVNGEQTAITTVPPQIATVPVYVPQTPTSLPPTPTPLPSPTPAATAETATGAPASLAWNDVAPIFAAKCGQCHIAAASGGLNLGTYAEAMKGGADGPVIIAGDAGNSKLFQLQSAGGHYGQLSADELAMIKAWIEAGAVEK